MSCLVNQFPKVRDGHHGSRWGNLKRVTTAAVLGAKIPGSDLNCFVTFTISAEDAPISHSISNAQFLAKKHYQRAKPLNESSPTREHVVSTRIRRKLRCKMLQRCTGFPSALKRKGQTKRAKDIAKRKISLRKQTVDLRADVLMWGLLLNALQYREEKKIPDSAIRGAGATELTQENLESDELIKNAAPTTTVASGNTSDITTDLDDAGSTESPKNSDCNARVNSGQPSSLFVPKMMTVSSQASRTNTTCVVAPQTYGLRGGAKAIGKNPETSKTGRKRPAASEKMPLLASEEKPLSASEKKPLPASEEKRPKNQTVSEALREMVEGTYRLKSINLTLSHTAPQSSHATDPSVESLNEEKCRKYLYLMHDREFLEELISACDAETLSEKFDHWADCVKALIKLYREASTTGALYDTMLDLPDMARGPHQWKGNAAFFRLKKLSDLQKHRWWERAEFFMRIPQKAGLLPRHLYIKSTEDVKALEIPGKIYIPIRGKPNSGEYELECVQWGSVNENGIFKLHAIRPTESKQEGCLTSLRCIRKPPVFILGFPHDMKKVEAVYRYVNQTPEKPRSDSFRFIRKNGAASNGDSCLA